MTKSTLAMDSGLRADTEAPTTITCRNPDCIVQEHEMDEPGMIVCIAARAEHGSVELEVFRRPEDGTWKLEIEANFIYRTDGVTNSEAKALAKDIVDFADLVETLNHRQVENRRFVEIVTANLQRILLENDDSTPIEEFGDLNHVDKFTEAGFYVNRYGRNHSDLVDAWTMRLPQVGQ